MADILSFQNIDLSSRITLLVQWYIGWTGFWISMELETLLYKL